MRNRMVDSGSSKKSQYTECTNGRIHKASKKLEAEFAATYHIHTHLIYAMACNYLVWSNGYLYTHLVVRILYVPSCTLASIELVRSPFL